MESAELFSILLQNEELISMIINIIKITLVILLIFHLVEAFGLYGMAKKLNMKYAWFAFIPVLNLHTMGKLSGNIKFMNNEISNMELVLPISSVVGFIISIIPIVGLILSFIPLIFCFLAIYNIFKKYKGKKAASMIIISSIFPFMFPIYLFLLRNSTPITDESA